MPNRGCPSVHMHLQHGTVIIATQPDDVTKHVITYKEVTLPSHHHQSYAPALALAVIGMFLPAVKCAAKRAVAHAARPQI
jgi:hypothetical protein